MPEATASQIAAVNPVVTAPHRHINVSQQGIPSRDTYSMRSELNKRFAVQRMLDCEESCRFKAVLDFVDRESTCWSYVQWTISLRNTANHLHFSLT